MDLRIGLLLLLLLLAYASGTCSHAGPAAAPGIGPSLQRHHHHHHHQHNHPRRQLRPQRELSEFLVPPPMPLNFRGPRGPPPRQPARIAGPPQRTGRYAASPFSKLMTWLGPFGGNEEPTKQPPLVNSNNNNNLHQQQPQAAASQPRHQIAQYAPQQPYVGTGTQYEPQAQATVNHHQEHSGSQTGITAWMNGKPCNPCNQVPWVPMFPENYPSQYAPNSGQNTYLPPATSTSSYEIQTYAPAHQGHQNPYIGVMPPLINAQPFNKPPEPSFDHQPQLTLNSQPPSGFDQHQSLNLNSQPPGNFDHHQSTSFNSEPPSSFDHQSSTYNSGPSNFDHHLSSSFNAGPSAGNFDHHQSSFNGQPPSSNFDHRPSSFDSGPPGNFDHHQASNFNSEPSGNFDHHQSSSDINVQSPGNVDDHHHSSNFNGGPSGNLDHHQSTNFDQLNSQSSFELDHAPDEHESQNYEDQHRPPNSEYSSSSYEQHHQSSQIIGVVKEAPEQSHGEPEHAESRPVYVDASSINGQPQQLTPRPPDTKTFHFQRSPIIDLSVAGESSSTTSSTTTTMTTTKRPVYRPPAILKKPIPTPKVKSPPATISSVSVIDYIVDETAFASSEETRPIPSATTTSTTTTTTTTAAPVQDQRSQESFIETLVQSYEIFKKDDETDDKRRRPPPPYNETIAEDSSASKEVVMPSKNDSGEKNKKIIQIIIPYTSQYTASPFHPTRSVVSNGHARGETHPEVEDNAVLISEEESRRVSVTRKPPQEEPLRNRTNAVKQQQQEEEEEEAARLGNTIDVHRLQKNIDNWTIQEYSKSASTRSRNSTYPRWLSSKQIPDEYLLTASESDENSSEYWDFSNDTKPHRGGLNKTQQVSITTTTTTTTQKPTTTTKVSVINATYPKKPPKKSVNDFLKLNSSKLNSSGEKVYVVTPVTPSRNSQEKTSSRRRPKGKEQRDTVSVEQAYQVLPQAVNNLAVVSNVPNSAAPVLWGIMEHEEVAGNVEQPRWRSESDAESEASDSSAAASVPEVYTGHSKVARAR